MQKRVLFFAVVIFFAAAHSWAQQQECKTASIAATTSHLVGKADGTVADSKTKLMWKRCPEGFNYVSLSNSCSEAGTIEYSWENALTRPAAVNANGFPNSAGLPNYKNWRLPNIKELQSIVEEQCYNPAVNLTAFRDAAGVEKIWSNSPSAVGTGSSWYIELYYGDMLGGSRSTETLGVRLVRDCVGTECD
ncbi:MAG: Lcl C-terminal domain-containing protein [Candidatus Electronema sp. VV]